MAWAIPLGEYRRMHSIGIAGTVLSLAALILVPSVIVGVVATWTRRRSVLLPTATLAALTMLSVAGGLTSRSASAMASTGTWLVSGLLAAIALVIATLTATSLASMHDDR